MNNEFEKSNPGQKQEQAQIPEQTEIEREISKTEFQENLDKAKTEVENQQKEVILSADKRIEGVSKSSGLLEEKTTTIYEQGGFAKKISVTKEQINGLGEHTKTEIENLTPDPKGKKQQYKSVMEYTKEKTPEERKILTEKIKQLRHEKFQLDRELGQGIDGLLQEAEAGRLAAKEAVKQIQASEERLLQLKEGLISRVVNFREIRKNQKQVGTQKVDQEKFDEQYRNTQELISNLETQKIGRSKLEQARGLLDEFYANKEKEWTNYEKEEEERGIKNVLKKYNVIMVHAFTPRGAPSENTLIRSDISWEEKLRIVLAFEPTISTSAISPEQQGMWANMGVLLNGGRVEAASPQDIGTRAISRSKREVRHSNEPIEQQIQRTISYHHEGDFMNYNEIVVSNPEVAGFFIKVREDDSIDRIGVSSEQVFTAVEKIDLPMFAVKNGEVYRINPSGTEKVLVNELRQEYKTVLKLGEKVTPEDLANLPAAIDKGRKEQFAIEIMEDSPFELKMAEAKLTDARNAGRESYIGANFSKLNKLENIPTEIYQSSGRYENQRELVGKEVKVLSEIKSPVATYRLLSFEGKLYNQSINKRTGKRATYEALTRAFQKGCLLTGVDYPIGDNFGAGKPIDSTNAYLEKIQITIDHFRKELEEAKQEQREDNVAWFGHFLRQTAFHLYGFAEEAIQRGDRESQEAASRLATEISSPEEYQNVVSRRVGPNGEFKIAKEDLESL